METADVRHARDSSWWMPGATLAAVGAAAMQSPSLFPKDAKLQRVGTLLAAGIGFAVGTGAEAVANALHEHGNMDELESHVVAGAVGGAAAAAMMLTRGGRSTMRNPAAVVNTAGLLIAGGAGLGATSTIIGRHRDDIPGANWIAQGATAAAAGAVVLKLARTNAALAANNTPWLLPDLPELAGSRELMGTLAQDFGDGIRGIKTSGGPGSLLPESQLNGQGKRFLTEMPRAEEIANVMGTDVTSVKEPIRAYASLQHGDIPDSGDYADVQRRAQLLVSELKRLGAFGQFEPDADGSLAMVKAPRAAIMVAAPTSSGFVNPVAASSFEMMHGGDTAIATMQVGTKKSAGELHHVARSTASHQAVLEALHAELQHVPEQHRPKVLLYGESFGAWSSQNGLVGSGDGMLALLARQFGGWDGPTSFVHAGDGLSRMDALGVDGAMYVGTPWFSPMRKMVIAEPALTGGETPTVLQIRDLTSAKAIDAQTASKARVTFLQHDADPVGRFNLSLFYRRPEFLGQQELRGQNIPPYMMWKPIVSGLQLAFDQQNAQYFRQGVLEAKGHDYRSEITYVMRRAFQRDGVTDSQIARIREWNRQLEELHAQRQAASGRAG